MLTVSLAPVLTPSTIITPVEPSEAVQHSVVARPVCPGVSSAHLTGRRAACRQWAGAGAAGGSCLSSSAADSCCWAGAGGGGERRPAAGLGRYLIGDHGVRGPGGRPAESAEAGQRQSVRGRTNTPCGERNTTNGNNRGREGAQTISIMYLQDVSEIMIFLKSPIMTSTFERMYTKCTNSGSQHYDI